MDLAHPQPALLLGVAAPMHEKRPLPSYLPATLRTAKGVAICVLNVLDEGI